MNVLVMYDRQTGSLWSQLLGEAVQGELIGTRLEFVPSLQTTWAEWYKLHPETLALQKGFSGAFDPYDSYYSSGDAGVIGERTTDNRLYTKEFVVGVENEGSSIAFPFSELNTEPVINYQLEGLDLLVFFHEDTASGVVFNRKIGEQTLNFELAADGLLKDKETGTTWDGISGEAIAGALLGKQLERVKSTSSFWFGWKDFYQDTKVYGAE